MTPVSVAEHLGGEDFLARVLHRDYRHLPAAVATQGLLTWGDLNRIIAGHRLEPPRLRLSREGATLPLTSYASPVTTHRHTVWHRLHPAELHARLCEGASLALDGADELHGPLARFAEGLERRFRTRARANVYASWTAREGFGTHWDDHDVVVVQLDGAKRWKIFGATRAHPLYRDVEQPGEPPAEPLADVVLRTGDLLYVPRGWWHAVSADQGTRSLHVTFGLDPHTPSDLLSWLAEQLLRHEEFRADLPRLAPEADQAAFLAVLRTLLTDELRDPGLLARYTRAVDARAPGRMAPSLPHLDGVPADRGLRVRMTTARAVLDTTSDAVLLTAAGATYEFAPAAGPVLRPLVEGHARTLGELADAAGLDVADVAGLVQELVEGQVVAVCELL
ncbi:cupin domain-containing protein [Streptomyces albireticuli]|uniref:cupin domain-containing protein n=1 Tax=Streptomyces albireticuli TaxID=1940 RepID=UPI0036A72165